MNRELKDRIEDDRKPLDEHLRTAIAATEPPAPAKPEEWIETTIGGPTE